MNKYKPHNKLLTIGLSIIFPGAGHFYVGHIKKAVIILPLIMIIQYIFLYIFTIYNNNILTIIVFIINFSLYLYGIYNPIQIINQKKDKNTQYTNGIFTLMLFIPIYYAIIFFSTKLIPLRSFSIPSTSMENTIYKGDLIVAKKTYNIHRGELSVFGYQHFPNILDLGRCVAIEGDEVIYINKQLLIHFKEGNKYIENNYFFKSIVKIKNKLWVINPYIDKISTIKYIPNYNSNSFQVLISTIQHKGSIGMEPIYSEELNSSIFTINDKKFNAFYIKIKDNHFFMMGDNRDNSNDSRFRGYVYRLSIYGKAKVYFTLLRTLFTKEGKK